MPPRRQRKRKVQTALSGTQFIEVVNDSFDEGAFEEASFKDMFDDLKEIHNLNQNLESYFTEFYERIVCGCSGILVGEPAEPKNFSMLSCQEDALEAFCQAFEEFLQRFPILRNQMDKVIFRFLARFKNIDVKYQNRLLRIISLFIKNKTYNKSKKEEFFLTASCAEPEGIVAVCKCLDAIKNEITPEFTFEFAKQYGFLQIMKTDDFDMQYFKDTLPWFMNSINQLNQQEEKKDLTQNLIEAFKKESDLTEAATQAKQLCSNQKSWIELLCKASLQSLDVSKFGIQQSQQQFSQLIPMLKQEINSVHLQGFLMDLLMKECYEHPSLCEMFKPCLMILYNAQIIDGNVIIAWYERAQGNGKATFGKQIFRFVEWLKAE
ncbi:Elongation_initiation factor 5C [Hexamita inflata]|uniref:Elongation initiation factor 5C n=1 Tax=Hexamita inflata TaxID=28002 RepID=A0AA86NWB4_9EUKA|nr:Elongation initiation factor 5C [Hexamita inflata]